MPNLTAGLLIVEKEYACSCGCGQKAKGFMRPEGWYGFIVNEPYYPGFEMRCYDRLFASRYCVRRYFKDWEPAPLVRMKAKE